MKGTLFLRGISLPVVLGALPEEKLFPRTVTLDLSFAGTATAVPAADYSEVCSCIAVLAGSRFEYLEQLAESVVKMLGQRWPGAWRVTVKKPFPPVCLSMESAEYTVEG